MSSSGKKALDHVAWAKRVNSRWIVHHDLNRDAESYLGYLEQVDRQRLERSCRNACLMVEQCGAAEDPKPWFYAGLFSLVTSEEAAKFLADHWLTKIVTGTSQDALASPVEGVSETTLAKIQRIQGALAKLPGEPS